MPGPPPKRTSQRRRRNKPSEPVTKARGGGVTVPEPDESWHPTARRLFDGATLSGQAAFYQQSDWEALFLLCDSISREFHPQPMVTRGGDVVEVTLSPKASSLAAWSKMMSALLLTEGDRRRVRLELGSVVSTEKVEDGADVSELDAFRNRVHGGGAG
ncbi:hypothetical protein BH24ACT5_BH24ACT5_04710 [soil metagenome]